MRRWSIIVGMLVGGVLLTFPAHVSAGDYGRDPIISDSLRRKSLGLPNRYAPKSSTRYRYEGNTLTSPSGSVTHRYKYRDGLGNTYKGKIETFPGGAYRHRGSWK